MMEFIKDTVVVFSAISWQVWTMVIVAAVVTGMLDFWAWRNERKRREYGQF